MTTSKQEIEVKLYTPNLKSIIAALEANGASLKSERVFERNVRYEDHEFSLTPQGIVVRLRQDVRTLLTFKGPGIVENGIISREEFEAVKEMARLAREENEALKARIAALEAKSGS